MSGERRGRTRELDVARVLRTQYGMVAYRLAWGHADVIGLRAGLEPVLVQVKATRRPYERFGPADRLALQHEAVIAGARPVLAHWPSKGRLTFIDADEWPRTDAITAAVA